MTTKELTVFSARSRDNSLAEALANTTRINSHRECLLLATLYTATKEEPEDFHDALDFQMRQHSDTNCRLHRAVVKDGESFNVKTLSFWRRGLKVPQNVMSFEVLSRIECRYGLSPGYFKAKIRGNGRAALDHRLSRIPAAERRRLVWHLPDDFAKRSVRQRQEILCWVRKTIISGSTEYRRYQSAATKYPYALWLARGWKDNNLKFVSERQSRGSYVEAPRHLVQEMERLVEFKTAALTEAGYQRIGTWGPETAAQKVEHFSLLFGALASCPSGPIKGCGIPVNALCMALLVLPQIWDWYLRWRCARRGFYTVWEVDMLRVVLGLTRRDTGWMRQNPRLAERLSTIEGLINSAELDSILRDWEAACDRLQKFASTRAKEIERIARVHRDPFEPILPVLETERPVAEYRKIADEVLKRMPNKRRHPLAAAEAVRAYLMLRLGIHLGLRQKNLRQLLFKRRGEQPSSERYLADRRCGELRWNARSNTWEVFVPAVAFKNVNSSFFGKRPFKLQLPDLQGLYLHIDEYLAQHRERLLKNADDPGTFFIKTVKRTSTEAAYNQNSFYDAWRLTVQRYGIYNPYTERGAIVGLLPHGPHSVRDVLATHVLKATGSFEQASYAIQDTPEMVAKHYGRFLPEEKATMAARIVNKVWEAT